MILHGRDLMKKGVLRRIGDGKSISIKFDNWIPGVNLGLIQTRVSLDQKVRLLLTQDGRSWNENIVIHFFFDEEANQILGIPISDIGSADFASWPHSRLGIYTVPSAYNLTRLAQSWQARNSFGAGSGSNQATI